MSEGRFLHLTIEFKDKADPAGLEKVINKAIDWIRYSSNSWILWTTSTPDVWFGRLKPMIKSGDRVLIVACNPADRAGFLPKWAWDWMQKHQPPKMTARLGQPQ